MCRPTCIEPSIGFSFVGMERMTLLRPNSSKCEASGNPEAADRKRTLYSDWKGFSGWCRIVSRRIRTKGSSKAPLNRNGLSCLSEPARALHRPLPMLIHGAGDGRSPRTQCCGARAYDPKCRSHRHPEASGVPVRGSATSRDPQFPKPCPPIGGQRSCLGGLLTVPQKAAICARSNCASMAAWRRKASGSASC